MPSVPSQPTVPERLLAFLDRLGAELDRRDDAVTRDRYLADIDWLEAAHPVVWSFENSDAGRKALLEGDLFAEYAVFSLAEMDTAGYPPGRVHWQRADAPAGLDTPTAPLPGTPRLEEQV